VFDGDEVEKIVSIARTMAKVVVVDMPKGWGEVYEQMAAQADELVLVSSPDLAALRNCRMIVEDVATRRVDGRKPRVVLNRMGMSKRNEYGAADYTESGGGAPAALVPWDPEVLLAAIADGRPLMQAGGKAVTALKAFAGSLLAHEVKVVAKKGKGAGSLLAEFRAKLNGLTAKKGKA
jgi:pilus assembly protein CpaE